MPALSWVAAVLAAAVVWSAGCGDDDGDPGDGGDNAADAAGGDVDGGPGDAGTGDDDASPGDIDAGATLAACADPIDEDGDELGGYPDDPGCAGLDDDDESDDCPDGPSCPACGNAVDDDRDLAQDYPGDIGCSDAADEDESDSCIPGLDVRPLEWGSQHVIEPGPSLLTATCDIATADNPENVHAFRVTQPLEALFFGREIMTPGFDFTTSISYADCGDPAAELSCEIGRDSPATVQDPALGTYYVFADANTATVGQYSFFNRAIVPSGAACGAPVPGTEYQGECIPSEECDNFPSGGTCVPRQCFDGIDNDGDERVDSPDDPGCRSVFSNEGDDACPAASCPACANEIDDDLDLLVDLDDPDCLNGSSDAERPRICPAESDALIQITGPSLTGTTVGAVNDLALAQDSACGDGDVDGGSPDLVYWIYLPGLASLRVADNDSFFGRTVGMGSGCDSINDCMESVDDDSAGFEDAIGYVYVVIDGAGGNSGAYDFTVSGIYQAGEPCDPAHIDAGIMECAEFTDCIDGVCRY